MNFLYLLTSGFIICFCHLVNIVHNKTKARLQTLLTFLEQRDFGSHEIILNKLVGGSALFPDNE